jgi:hypothetical protein
MAQITFVDRGSTITLGGTQQQVMAQNRNRKYFLFQNQSTHNMWINFGANANNDQTSILILPNGSYEMDGYNAVVNTDQCNVYGTTTSDAYCAKETP